MKLNVNIGDKVVCNYGIVGLCNYGIVGRRIGTVVNITKTRKDIVVDYGQYKETYGADGFRKGGDIWRPAYIELLTPEIEADMRKEKLISECRSTFEAKYKQLTADQAEKILAILNEEDITE